MEKQNNNKGLYAVIVILCCLVLFLGGYIIYDKSLENNTELNNNNNNINNDNDNYSNWMDYVMNADISSVKLEYCVDDPSNEYEIPTKKTIDITKNDLNRIFSEMKKGTLSKNYYGGLGGPCMPSINVNYTVNDKQYGLDLFLYRFIDTTDMNDKKVLNYIENSNYTIKKYSNDIDLDTESFMFEYTYNENIIDTIIDEYIK